MLASLCAFAQFSKQNINDGWQFNRSDNADWQQVDLPHTWNAQDVLDDETGYYRGGGTYQKTLQVKKEDDKRYHLFFEGANQELTLFVNNQEVGNHIGGYTSFGFDITEFLKNRGNEILVKLTNAHDPNIIPLEADFNFFGGIYRDVWLLTTGQAHFDYSYGFNGGAVVEPKVVEPGKYNLKLVASVTNSAPTTTDVIISTTLTDAYGKEYLSKKYLVEQLLSAETSELSLSYSFYDDVTLWSPAEPQLYDLNLQIIVDGKMVDQVLQKVGFRTFAFDNDGFVLNGEKMKLIGTNRHQDEIGKGFALSNADHLRDLMMLKEMGINFLRVSHYPQDPRILELTDSLGIIAIEEIPFVNEATASPEFAENTKNMMLEMISRDRNHTSLFSWGTSNELTLRLDRITKDFTAVEKQNYIDFEVALLNDLDELIKQTDTTRPSFTVHCCGKERNKELGYHAADLIGYNKYFGWYEGTADDVPDFLDEFAALEDRPFFLSEYGAGADPRIRAENPRRFDFSIEWQNIFHQKHLKAIVESNNLFGANVWNFADFQAEHRGDAVPKINNKGIVTVDRVPKDAYYFYQVALSSEPIVKLPAKLYTNRIGIQNGKKKSLVQPIEVYSNQPYVELWLNGKSLSFQEIDHFSTTFQVPLKQGANQLKATVPTQSATDQLELNARILPTTLKKLDLGDDALRINVGAHFIFSEEVNGDKIWLADKPYTTGSYGYHDGEVFLRDQKELVGSDRNILTTNNDPVYQTQRRNLSAYQIDIGKGNYHVELHFAKLNGQENIAQDASIEVNGEVVTAASISTSNNFSPIVLEKEVKVNKDGLLIELKGGSETQFLNGIIITEAA